MPSVSSQKGSQVLFLLLSPTSEGPIFDSNITELPLSLQLLTVKFGGLTAILQSIFICMNVSK